MSATRIRRAIGMAAGLVFLIHAPLMAQSMDALDAAVQAYNNAQFDSAIEQFAEIAEDQAADKDSRKQALQFLGRSYVAKRQENLARGVMEDLIELEPPIVELDPDSEPLPLMRLYYDVRRSQTDSYEVERTNSNMQTLAIVDFANHSLEDHERYNALQGGLASLLINQLSGATELKVIERERIQWLLRELDLQQTPGRVDQRTAVKTGKLLGANAVVFGTFMKVRNEVVISARVVSVETGEILLTRQVKGNEKSFFELVNELSLEIASGVNVQLQEASMEEQGGTRSLDAMIYYSEGLDLIERENYPAAMSKFQDALKADPNYNRARQKAESLMPLLHSAG